MRGILMRFFSGILIVFFLVSPAPGAAAGEMAMKEGSHGAAVHALKVRLFDLGYLDAVHDANDRYGPATAAQVAHFQERSGLPATGEADARTLEALYSPGAVKAPLPEGRPLYDVDPDAVPDVRPDGMPDLDAGGFLPQGSEPFVYKNRAAGYWAYVSDRLNISVTRFYQAAGQIEWFEAYVSFRGGGKPVSVESDRDGKALEQPLHLAREAGAVLALSDDFWRYRKANELHTGIIVRDGRVLADHTYPQDRSRIPSLEVLALFGDGTMRTFASDAYTGQGYLDMGVTDTWAFGPALVQEGEVPRYFYSRDYRSYREPRCALGMIAPGEYCALVVTGRKEGSRGATFGWMAEKMRAMGAKEALNLDGGGTAALIFMGELLNHPEAHQDDFRAVSGLIAFR